jgi:hypothetical protein
MVISLLPASVFAADPVENASKHYGEFYFWETIQATTDSTEFDGGNGDIFYCSSASYVSFFPDTQTVQLREYGTRFHTPLISGDYSLQFNLKFSSQFMNIGNVPTENEGLYFYPPWNDFA